MLFAEHKVAKGNEDGLGEIDKERTFAHRFLVTDIKPLARQEHKVQYEIDLVSMHWENCIANIQYTNYDKGHEPIMQILKTCLR